MNCTNSHTPPRAPAQGEHATVNLTRIREHCRLAPYLSLIRKVVCNAGNEGVYVARIEHDMAYIRAWRGDLLGDVRVPLSSLTYSA